MWQTIAVILIGIAAVTYVAYRVYHLLTRPKSDNPCEHCAGCVLNNKEECSTK